jgi:hypothetical protein
LGGVAELITLACDTAVALTFYDLLKPVSRSLSLLAAICRLMLVAIMAVNLLHHFAPLFLLGDAHFLTAFKPDQLDQLQALALVSLKVYGTGYDISLVFFGFHCLLIGYLILTAAFLPQNTGPADGDCGLVLPDQQFRERSCAWARIPFSLHSSARRRCGTIADPLASRDRRERTEVGRASKRLAS